MTLQTIEFFTSIFFRLVFIKSDQGLKKDMMKFPITSFSCAFSGKGGEH
jgi:hypothetical protein